MSWGRYRDTLRIEIDEMDAIEIEIELNSTIAPLTTPTSFIRLGGVGSSDGKVQKRVPITNLAPHPVSIQFFLLDSFEESMFAEYGELPLALDDETEPSENSVYNCGELIQAVSFQQRRMPFTLSVRSRWVLGNR